MDITEKLKLIVEDLYNDSQIEEEEYEDLLWAAEDGDLETFELWGFETEADVDEYLSVALREATGGNWVVKDAENRVVKRGLSVQAAYDALQEPGWTMGVGL